MSSDVCSLFRLSRDGEGEGGGEGEEGRRTESERGEPVEGPHASRRCARSYLRFPPTLVHCIHALSPFPAAPRRLSLL